MSRVTVFSSGVNAMLTEVVCNRRREKNEDTVVKKLELEFEVLKVYMPVHMLIYMN